MIDSLRTRWKGDGGYREVLTIAFPLILSSGSITIQHFIDRMFLAWHSSEAIASAMPAGMVSFTIMALFFGTTTYVNTFVAQYHGAKRYQRIGPAVWQGLYFSILAALAILPLYFLAPQIFALAGHAPTVQRMETDYFQILVFSGFAVTASSAMASFFSGRGKTKTVMWVMFASTTVNIILDYGLIFGNLSLPAMGIRGAALATVISQYVRVFIYAVLLMKVEYRRQYLTLAGWKPEAELLKRLFRYGFPNGLHYFLELIGFTLLIMFVGRLGTAPLAATNITFNINHLAFLPMMGVGTAVSVLVGKRLGECRPEVAEKTAWSAFHLGAGFMACIVITYIFIPNVFLFPYAANANALEFAPIARIATNLMKFAAVYMLFDMMNILFAAAIKGAGDTRFVMGVSLTLSWLLMVIPSYIALTVFNRGIYTLWTFSTSYIIMLGIAFLLRFSGGKWKSMRVIEGPCHPVEPHPPVIPAPETELSYTEAESDG